MFSLRLDRKVESVSSIFIYVHYIFKFELFLFFFVLKDHLDQHHQHPVCSHCNQQCHSVNNLNEHQISQCKKLAVGCLLKDFGCNEHVEILAKLDQLSIYFFLL